MSDEVLDPEPVHSWFGLSYSNYQVLHRTLMQSMPVEWQRRMVACLEEMRDAFLHVEEPDCYIVEPAIERTYSDLSDVEMKQLGLTHSDTDPDWEGPTVYWDRYGDEHEPFDRVLVPLGTDPVPPYNRGRTFVAPMPRGLPAI